MIEGYRIWPDRISTSYGTQPFVNGVELFKEALSNNAEKAQLVYKRTDKFFINIGDVPYKIPSAYYVSQPSESQHGHDG
jgi:hypothetical protein